MGASLMGIGGRLFEVLLRSQVASLSCHASGWLPCRDPTRSGKKAVARNGSLLHLRDFHYPGGF